MFYCEYDTILEERESKLSSQGDIRTDLSNTDESFVLDVNQYLDFCDDADDKIDDQDEEEEAVLPRSRFNS